MQWGDFELTTVCGGRYEIDGGTMFGVVPRTLWARSIQPNDDNLIAQTTNCLLVRREGSTVLVDTGYGSKLEDKQRRILRAEGGDPLLQSLAEQGVTAADVDVVILTHLHFDHAGGATRYDEAGELVPTFPNAEYLVQRREWVLATADLPELQNAYPQDNLLPLKETGCLRLVDGDCELTSGIHARVTGGHTQWHQAVLVEGYGDIAVYLGDICPTTHHLPTLWCMSYDVDILQTRRQKAELLGCMADGGWLAMFDHDPDVAAAYLERHDRRDFACAETWTELVVDEAE